MLAAEKIEKRINRKIVVETDGDAKLAATANAEGLENWSQMQETLRGSEYAALQAFSKQNDMMRINVVDNFKCQKQAFSVSRSLLTKHMAYFNKVLADYAAHDKINITIHCDVGVFSWLLDYIFELESA